MIDLTTMIGRCRFASPTDPMCLADATHHGVHACPEHRMSFAVCEQHKPLVEPVCTHLHDFDSPCELPGSEFLPTENRCVMPDLNPPRARAAEEVAPA